MPIDNRPNPMPPYQDPQGPVSGKQSGQGAAVGSLVCGILAAVLGIFLFGGVVSLILAAVGLVLASKAKKEGFSGGLRTAGFVLSVIGLVVGAVGLIACVACSGALYEYYRDNGVQILLDA